MTVVPTVRASAFCLLIEHASCHSCQVSTAVGAIWVGNYEDLDEQAMDPGGAAVLSYIEWLGEEALIACQARLPRMAFASTRTSGLSYLANHCEACGSVQGDHFIHGPDGPFWPQSEAVAKFEILEVPLAARASLSQAAWMDTIKAGL